MAGKIGKMVICDRCGDSVFLECIGEGETDDGCTRWNKYEAAPEGWVFHLDIGDLCPKCNLLRTNIIKGFMNKESITSIVSSSGCAQIDNRDYDKMKNGEKVVVTVSAVNRKPMSIECSSKAINDIISRYENTQFNGSY